MSPDRLKEASYAALRIGAGAMFSLHGAQKILGVLTSHAQPPVGSQLWIGGVIELACGLLIALGLFTRPAAFLASGTMAVAYAQFHWKLEMAGWKFLPIVNQGELAVLYALVFLVLFSHGPGRASLDGLRRGAQTGAAPGRTNG
jgi:putative oxidoreductase